MQNPTAAQTLWKLYCACPVPYVPSQHAEPYEKALQAAVEKATKDLETYRISKAARLALDAICPGWFEVDVSDILPREKWCDFVSNSESEWVDWLVAQGIDRKLASAHVKADRKRKD